MSEQHYDLVVIGSGPAGEKGAAQAAYFGKKVALVEKESVLGGAAANTGTLPSKTLRETALYLSGFRQRDLYGVNFSLKKKVTVQDFLFRERAGRKANARESSKTWHDTTWTSTQVSPASTTPTQSSSSRLTPRTCVSMVT